MKITLTALPAVMLLTSGIAAYAQSNPYIGQWHCEFAYTEFDQFGNRTSGHVQEYVLAVYSNGTYQANGNTIGPAGALPFESQGQWSSAQGFFNAQGQLVEQSMFGPVPRTFMMVANADPGGSYMINTIETPDSSNSYLMARSNMVCQKQR